VTCLLKAGIVKAAETAVVMERPTNTPVSEMAATDMHATLEELLVVVFSV
jgi:hypothetical protein